MVGDVHGDWDDGDRAFVEGGPQDHLLFVGDFGDEDVALIERIAAIRCPKAVVLGNHDAWHASRGGRADSMIRIMEILGDDHLAWRARPIKGGSWVLAGGRSFSWGGKWAPWARFYREQFELESAEASAARIVEAVRTAHCQPDASVIVFSHDGPLGAGGDADSPWGRDYQLPPADHGDPDLALALDRLRADGRRLPLVVAGHMHDRLKFGGLRRRRADYSGTVHLNAAVVPRHVRTETGTLRHYLRVLLDASGVLLAEDLFVDGAARIAGRSPIAG